MSRLTTVASTGRRMKRSVKAFIGDPSRPRRFGWGWKRGRFVDRDRHIGLQLDLSGGHHFLAPPQAVLDRNSLAARRTNLHEAPHNDEAAHAALIAHAALLTRMRSCSDDKDIVAVETVNDCSAGDRQHRGGLSRRDRQIGEHAWQKLAIRVREHGASGDIARFGADACVDRLDLALETAARDSVDGHADELTYGARAQRLLWHGKISVDRVKLLQGHEARSHRDILPEIDIAQAEPA